MFYLEMQIHIQIKYNKICLFFACLFYPDKPLTISSEEEKLQTHVTCAGFYLTSANTQLIFDPDTTEADKIII